MINKKFLTLRTNSYIKKNKGSRASIPYNNSKKIGVLFSANTREKFDSIKDFVQKLENDGKEVSVLSYLGKGKDNYEFRYEIFTSRDVSFFGKYKSAAVNSFIEKKFDYLFCMDLILNPFIENILARSNAKCRIGRYSAEKSQLFEFMIDIKEDQNALTDNMYHYTKKITQNEFSV